MQSNLLTLHTLSWAIGALLRKSVLTLRPWTPFCTCSLVVSKFPSLHKGLLSMLNKCLCRVKDKNQAGFFFFFLRSGSFREGNRVLSYRLVCTLILGRHFLNWCSLLSDDSSLCQGGIKPSSTLPHLASRSWWFLPPFSRQFWQQRHCGKPRVIYFTEGSADS